MSQMCLGWEAFFDVLCPLMNGRLGSLLVVKAWLGIVFGIHFERAAWIFLTYPFLFLVHIGFRKSIWFLEGSYSSAQHFFSGKNVSKEEVNMAIGKECSWSAIMFNVLLCPLFLKGHSFGLIKRRLFKNIFIRPTQEIHLTIAKQSTQESQFVTIESRVPGLKRRSK